MSAEHIGTLTITGTTNAGTTAQNSDAVDLKTQLDQFEGRTLGISAPATLTNTVHPQVDVSPNSTGDWTTVFQDAQGNTSQKVIVPAGGFRRITDLPASRLRVQSTANEDATRTFEVWMQ